MKKRVPDTNFQADLMAFLSRWARARVWRRVQRTHLATAMAVVGGMLAAGTNLASADTTCTSTNGINQDWQEVSNWECNNAPDANDENANVVTTLEISSPLTVGSVTVTSPGSITVKSGGDLTTPNVNIVNGGVLNIEGALHTETMIINGQSSGLPVFSAFQQSDVVVGPILSQPSVVTIHPGASINVVGPETLIVGDDGPGLLIQSGGATNDTNLIVGNQATGNGLIDLTGGTFNINHTVDGTGNAIIGNSGIGAFNHSNVDGDAIVNIGGELSLGREIGSSGSYSMTADPNNSYQLVLTTSQMTIGDVGVGSFNNSGGTHNVTGNLVLGNQEGSIGAYTLSSTGSLNVTGNTIIGSSGAGVFQQTGGTQIVAGDLVLGQEVASQGFYDLSSTGSLNVAGNTIIGSSGMGTFQLRDFTQQTVAGNLVLGDQETGTGAYNLGPTGSLHVSGATFVGNLGTGGFNQTGGVHTTDNELFVGSGSVYNLSNTGVLNTSITYLSSPNSTFNQDSDDSQHNTGYLNIYGGTYNLNAGTINVAGNMGVGHLFNDATFTQAGGHVFVNDPTYGLFVGGENGHTGTYNLNAGTLTVAANTTVGGSGNGTFNNTASGLHEVSGSLIIGDNAGSNGAYNLGGSGQVFVAGNIIIGQNANSTGVLNLNVNSGDAGSIFISPTSQVIIGDAGVGTVNVSLDNNFVSANTIVGNRNGSHGTINLFGAGNASVTGQMIVGSQAGSTGVVNLNVNSGDNANVIADVIVGDAGTGTINQGGGTFSGTGSETFVLGRSATGQGTYNLMGGTLNDSLIVGDAGVGEFNNSGGIHNVAGDLVLGNQATGNGAYNLSSTGSLNVTGNTIIGSSGQGTFEQTGGTQTVTGGVTIAANLGSSGTYNLSGGALDAGTMTVNVNGVLNYSGGALTLGSGTGTLTNNGGQVTLGGADTTITGNVSNTGTFNNNATNANVTGTFINNSGGTLTVNAPMAVGSLVQNSTTAGSITLNSDITVVTAYQNTGFGSGNSFNNRANVSGPGQVLSSNANAATQQQISVNGGPAAPNDVVITLNAHVGSSVSQNYTINNLAGGPSLTGAIQTTVNGGNITDNRLSGSGVTAGNWNAAAGGSTSPLGVTFNATSAGALTGQVVHVANNFDNTNSQNITIQGAGYNLATASVSPVPVTLGNQRVGGTATQALTITNTAPMNATYTETLSANVGGNTDDATHNGGSISGLAGGASNNTALQVGVDTSTAGARTGTVTVNLTSNEVNGSGLGNTTLAPRVITVSGNVYQVASGEIQSAPLNFGTVQVGQSVSQNLVIRNTAIGTNGFVEDLNASFGSASGTGAGLISGNGSLTGILAGADSTADNGTMTVSVNTGAAGVINGGIAVNYFTAGAVVGVSNGLGIAAVGSENYGVNGIIQATANVINQASPLVNNPVINLGAVRVGATSPTANVSVANVATVAPQAALNASISGNAPITASGSFNLLDPGSTNNTSLQVGMNTGAAGAINGAATIAFVSDASNVGNCAPNCQLTLASQTVTVTGGVYQVAQPDIPTDVNLGNFRLGSAPSQAITIGNTNVAPAGFQEGLDASVSGATGNATGTGSITNLAQGGSSSAIGVGINNATAGVNTGTVTIGLASNGSTTSGLATLSLASQTVNVQGTGYRLADPTLNTTSMTLAARVGGVGDTSKSSGAISITNTSPDAFTEGLNVTRDTTSAGFNSSGSVNNLNAQGTSTAIQVALNTGASGTFTGQQALNFVSTGQGTTGAPDVSVGTGQVELTGKVYTPAVAQIDNPTVDFGIVHVGDAVTAAALSVKNGAASTALNDVLLGSLGGVSGPFSSSGNLGAGLGAGQTADLLVALDTSTAGIFNDNASFNGVSHDNDLADLLLGGVAISLQAQVNNYANAALQKNSGKGNFSGNGNSYFLNFGDLFLNSGNILANLGVFNNVAGPADLLGGIFNFLDTPDFGETGFNPFSGLGAGVAYNGLNLNFSAAALGLGRFEDVIELSWNGSNSSGYIGSDNLITLTISANVIEDGINVPEPGTLVLMALGGLLLIVITTRRRVGVHRQAV